jgi:hypothetical protein
MLQTIEIGQGDEPSIFVKYDTDKESYHILPSDLKIILNNYLAGYYIGQYEDDIVNYIRRTRRDDEIAEFVQNKLSRHLNRNGRFCVVYPKGKIEFKNLVRIHKKAYTISEEAVESYWS